mgnify:CR=1 FL=1
MFELRHTDELRSYDDLVISTKTMDWLHYQDLVKLAEALSKDNVGIFYIKKIKE